LHGIRPYNAASIAKHQEQPLLLLWKEKCMFAAAHLLVCIETLLSPSSILY
jgi:hypothetical protein